MAKKGATTRVFQLAKEIGVPSKVLVEKCKSEEIPGITNHMSAVSLGLATTIREWFGVAESAGSGTAIETAAPVDVATVRATKATRKAKPRAKPAAKESPAAVATTEAPPAPPQEPEVPAAPVAPTQPEAPAPVKIPVRPTVVPVEPPPSIPTEPRVVEPPRVAASSDEPAVADAPPPTVAADADASAPGGSAPGGSAPASPGDSPDEDGPVMNVPNRPSVVGPAGPQLQKPSKTTLAGPKVIRVEKPDPIAAPRRPRSDSMGPGGPRAGRGVGGGAGAGYGDPAGPMQARGGSGAGAPGAGSRRNNRRRSASARDTGRTGRQGQGGAGATPGQAARPFNWREQDLLERERRLNRSAGFLRAARRDNQKRSSGGSVHRAQTAAETGGALTIEEPITIKSLSLASGLKMNDIVRNLIKGGHMLANTESPLPSELAMEVMAEFNIELDVVEQKSAQQEIEESFEARDMVDERPRSPVVTILGHVDHGKTSLLDQIRNANVADGEAGGITQATSAFRVPVTVGDNERMVTFIDTPGHEAFTEMRSRGAKVTDVVVLVVAADDGVMPQTIESINHAKAAGVPIVVALNKIDKAEATDGNIQRILGQLAEHELNPVEWGGSTEVLRISALKGEGIQELLEVLEYQAELLTLTADFGGTSSGTVIEGQIEEGRGAVARILVQHGKLKKGDAIVVGRAYGRVRDIVNDRGERINEAGPSEPVAISGIDEVPDAGDNYFVVKNTRAAEAAAQERRDVDRQRDLVKEKVTLDNIFEKLSEAERKDLPLIVKADVQGSLETLRATLGKIGSEEVAVVIKHSAVGGINESDIRLAEASGAIIVGFNVTSSTKARRLAEARGVDFRLYDVIYDLTDDVTKAAEGLLEPELRLEVLGHAEVKEVFKISKTGMIAGCYVTEGNIERDAQIRVTRGDIVVEKDRRLKQLKRFKDDAKTVNAGQECGMLIEGYDDIKVGDVLECYKTLEIRRSL